MPLWEREGSGVLFLPAGLLYFRFLLRHHVIGWPGVAGGVMFGAASHVAIVLGVSFDLRAGPPAPVFWVLGLAPLIAQFAVRVAATGLADFVAPTKDVIRSTVP